MTIESFLGYAAPAVILVSFLLKNVNHLRIVNTIGCALFVIYGFLQNPFAYPIIVTNAGIILINLYYLFRKEK